MQLMPLKPRQRHAPRQVPTDYAEEAVNEKMPEQIAVVRLDDQPSNGAGKAPLKRQRTPHGKGQSQAELSETVDPRESNNIARSSKVRVKGNTPRGFGTGSLPGSNNGGGRKPGWAYFRTRAQLELYLREVINEVRVGRWDEKTQVHVKMLPHEANAISGLARTILDSMKFSEELEIKVSDRAMVNRLQEMEQQQAQLEEYFAEQQTAKDAGGRRFQ